MASLPSNADFAAAWSASRDYMQTQEYADKCAAAETAVQQASYERAVHTIVSTFSTNMERYVGTMEAPSARIMSGIMGDDLETQFFDEVRAKGFTVTPKGTYFEITSPSI